MESVITKSNQGRVNTNSLSVLIKDFLSVITRWGRNAKTRRHLAELPSHLLDDVGIDRVNAEKESNKPFWK
ncbi:DUF1127 domain-containing protein [Vibrio tapetis]|uniref:DUF1127 domain-containing protein n=1 Tax=Vibrio tapetis TaxID=52443 RepID=UPI000C8235D4|nr:DUF1127 domain-containing protein [Vibrio tapetis]